MSDILIANPGLAQAALHVAVVVYLLFWPSVLALGVWIVLRG
ncbi:hypothetical protein [Sinorhizobium fredii]|nr:hypothetical protein [Sinorhizobium fredii]